jgi:hypothetical protein
LSAARGMSVFVCGECRVPMTRTGDGVCCRGRCSAGRRPEVEPTAEQVRLIFAAFERNAFAAISAFLEGREP